MNIIYFIVGVLLSNIFFKKKIEKKYRLQYMKKYHEIVKENMELHEIIVSFDEMSLNDENN